jgi:hypothetical protein
MLMTILKYLKDKMVEESRALALPSSSSSMNASTDRGPAWAGYVHPSYGMSTMSGPYVSMYPGVGLGTGGFPGGIPGMGVNFSPFGAKTSTGLYANPGGGIFGTGPEPGPSVTGNYGAGSGPGPSAGGISGAVTVPSVVTNANMGIGKTAGAGLSRGAMPGSLTGGGSRYVEGQSQAGQV